MTILASQPQIATDFYQQSPRRVCRHRERFAKLSEQRGHPVRCRDPYCSLDCVRNFAHQEFFILRYFWETAVPSGVHPVRGNLTMPPGATPDNHRTARAKFLRALARRASGEPIKLRCYMHITQRGAHYDFVGYSRRNPVQTHAAILAAWRVAGGLRASCKPLEGDEVRFSCYAVKARKQDDAAWRYLPVRGGPEYTWQTAGFWGKGNTRVILWKACIKTMYPGRYVARLAPTATGEATPETPAEARSQPGRPIIQKSYDKTSPHHPTPETPEADPLASWRSRYGTMSVVFLGGSGCEQLAREIMRRHPGVLVLEEDRPDTRPPDAADQLERDFLRHVPTGPADAMTPGELAEWIGWRDVDTVHRLCESHCTLRQEWLGPDGLYHYGGYYMPPDPS